MNRHTMAIKRAIENAIKNAPSAAKLDGLPQVGNGVAEAIEKMVDAKIEEAIKKAFSDRAIK